MSEKHPGWGGKRTPAGGGPKAERRMVKASVTLWPEQIKRLHAIGEGSTSEGIRRALAHYDRGTTQVER